MQKAPQLALLVSNMLQHEGFNVSNTGLDRSVILQSCQLTNYRKMFDWQISHKMIILVLKTLCMCRMVRGRSRLKSPQVEWAMTGS